MDISKFKIPTLDGPNWGQWYEHFQSTTHIIMVWEVIRGDILTPAPNLTRDLLVKPSPLTGTPTAAELATYNTAKSHWSQKNSQSLGLIQATISNVIWQKYESLSTAKEVLDGLETEFEAAGGGTDLPPIGQYGENSNHQFDRSATTDSTISGQLQPDNVEWPQRAIRRPCNFLVLLESPRLIQIDCQAISG